MLRYLPRPRLNRASLGGARPLNGSGARLSRRGIFQARPCLFLGLFSGAAYFIYTIRDVHADTDFDAYDRAFRDMGSTINDPFPATRLAFSDGWVTHEAPFGIPTTEWMTVASNKPKEDFTSWNYAITNDCTMTVRAIYDGHNGPDTAEYLRDTLGGNVLGALLSVYCKTPPQDVSSVDDETLSTPSNAQIDEIIKQVFVDLDNEIVHEAVKRVFASPSKADAIKELKYARAGSCALLAIYHKESRTLRIALTGDSRAVLGRRTEKDGKPHYEVHVLSQDQNAKNPKEDARMSAEHPGETIMDNGRVLGWGMARAFGDATYKWAVDVQQRLNREYLGDRPPAKCKTPPYFTASPEITTFTVKPGDFLIMGSDGLWDCLTNEEAVGLTGVWLERNAGLVWGNEGAKIRGFTLPQTLNDAEELFEKEQLPVTLQKDATLFYNYWRATKRFINVDGSICTHLARNALGGADRDLTEALLRMSPPRSRRYRDDLTTTVMFFD